MQLHAWWHYSFSMMKIKGPNGSLVISKAEWRLGNAAGNVLETLLPFPYWKDRKNMLSSNLNQCEKTVIPYTHQSFFQVGRMPASSTSIISWHFRICFAKASANTSVHHNWHAVKHGIQRWCKPAQVIWELERNNQYKYANCRYDVTFMLFTIPALLYSWNKLLGEKNIALPQDVFLYPNYTLCV